jgi:hypothetical protein
VGDSYIDIKDMVRVVRRVPLFSVSDITRWFDSLFKDWMAEKLGEVVTGKWSISLALIHGVYDSLTSTDCHTSTIFSQIAKKLTNLFHVKRHYKVNRTITYLRYCLIFSSLSEADLNHSCVSTNRSGMKTW